MTDKEIIRAEIERLQDGLMDAKGRFCTNAAESAYHILCHLENFIDSMQEEPVSEDLEHAVNAYIGYAPEVDESSSTYGKRQAFKAGANWQKQQMMKDAVSAKITEVYYPTDSCLEVEVTLPKNRFEDGDKILIIKED
jgi:hypothetical protein